MQGPSLSQRCMKFFWQWTFRAYPSSTTPHLTSSIFTEQFPMPDPTMFQVWKESLYQEAILLSMGSCSSKLRQKLCEAVRCCAVQLGEMLKSQSLEQWQHTRGERLDSVQRVLERTIRRVRMSLSQRCMKFFWQWTFQAYPSSTTPHLTSSIFTEQFHM